MNSKIDLNDYRENNLEMIENSLAFENQLLRGKIVNKDTNYSMYNGMKFLSNFRLHKANKLTQKIGTLLNLDQHLISAAQRLYKLAQSRNWVQGRSTSLVILTCLYITCRQNETGHLMIDFADVMDIDIFMLSKMYLKLCRFMHFDIRLNDPSLYVPRFYRTLNLPDNTKKSIIDYVLRLLARMREDWLGQGRRPTGLIAAAFYIAAKCFGIEKSIKEISVALKVSEETIRKRVNEFKCLKVAKLTKEEFDQLPYLNIKLGSEDPPSYKRNRLLSLKKSEEKNVELELNDNNDEEEVIESLMLDDDDLSLKELPPLQSALQMIEDENFDKREPYNEDEINSDEFDDREIDACLLKPYEITVKTLAWENANKEWIDEQLEKEKQKDAKIGDFKEKRKNERVKKEKKKDSCTADNIKTDNDVVRSILDKGKLGGKVNTSALEKLFDEAKNFNKR